MALRTLKSGVRTATGATDSFTFDNIRGIVHAIRFIVSASTNFEISEIAPDGTTELQHLFGTAGVPVTVAASCVHAVRGVPVDRTDGADIATLNGVVLVAIDGKVKVEASALTADDTWAVEIIVEVPE